MKVSLVIPAYNEAALLAQTLQLLTKVLEELPCEKEIIIVNDGSTDATAKILASFPHLDVLHHSRNRGYGASLKTGSRHATGDVVVFFDADGQHDPVDILLLLKSLGAADMVVGARQGLLHSPAWRIPGKWILTRLANYLTNQQIPDLNSGLRAIKRPVLLQYLHLCPDKFSFTTTLTMALFSENHDVTYVPIQVRPRLGDKSRVTVSTGFETFLLLLRLITLFNPMRVFLPTSAILLLLGIGWSSIFIWQQRGLSVGGMLLIMTALLMFFVGLIADQVAAIRREMYRRD
jgi:glycosyltransferase involved in cell wall biosynthesis